MTSDHESGLVTTTYIPGIKTPALWSSLRTTPKRYWSCVRFYYKYQPLLHRYHGPVVDAQSLQHLPLKPWLVFNESPLAKVSTYLSSRSCTFRRPLGADFEKKNMKDIQTFSKPLNAMLMLCPDYNNHTAGHGGPLTCGISSTHKHRSGTSSTPNKYLRKSASHRRRARRRGPCVRSLRRRL